MPANPLKTPPDDLIAISRSLSRAVSRLRFTAPVAHVYNPLTYAGAAYEEYLRKFAKSRKRALFMGMNPGPYGMTQTGVPFGEIAAVRDWMKIQVPIKNPRSPHPKRPILGFECQRSEVSGSRLWGLFADRVGESVDVFAVLFVANYCPLVFLAESGANITPDKLPAGEARALNEICDRHLIRVVERLNPEWLIGIGKYAEKRFRILFTDRDVKIGTVLHPSPASPAANKDWAGKASRQLVELGLWSLT